MHAVVAAVLPTVLMVMLAVVLWMLGLELSDLWRRRRDDRRPTGRDRRYDRYDHLDRHW